MASNSSFSALAVGLLLSGCSFAPVTSVAPAKTTDSFCIEAQAAIVSSKVQARNEIHTDVATFTKSKPVARPLVTTQYVWPESTAPNATAMMVSCKMKTADHLVSEYGPEAAGADIGCSGVNALTLQRVLASMTPAERRRLRFDGGKKVLMDPDIVTTMGPIWLEPYAMARIGESGHLRIQAKAMRNDWLDPRYLAAPPQFRGTRYCHLVAPEYLRRLLLGEVKPLSAS
ncbi:MAG: hypothetical protein RL412_289 [Pseudomonadota bacterium]|jgi:hypothetical protein